MRTKKSAINKKKLILKQNIENKKGTKNNSIDDLSAKLR